jgi:hypothetical protein
MSSPLTTAQLASAIQVRRYAMEREIIARQGQPAPTEAAPGDRVQAEGTMHDDPAPDGVAAAQD